MLLLLTVWVEQGKQCMVLLLTVAAATALHLRATGAAGVGISTCVIVSITQHANDGHCQPPVQPAWLLPVPVHIDTSPDSCSSQSSQSSQPSLPVSSTPA